jgi:heat shock protein 4
MSVVGFDIGNENLVIAAAKQRGIDVLLNDESKRETPAIVSFGEKQRFLGIAGAASATMNPRSTISQIKRMIGTNFNDPAVQKDLKLLPFETSAASDGGILIHLQYLNEKQTFTPVQLIAMLFAHLKQIAEKNLETPVSDCVIGIPSYFTDLQRRAYLHAAEISGLKPLRLMHDCTATALGYGIYKNDFSESGPANVVFVDIGHCDTQVSVASFEPGHMKILSHSFDMNLGGRDFDEVLFRYFATQFKEQYHIDVYSNTRASIRLRVSCEKLKKVLSANPEAPLTIECLMDEKDVKGFIKREDFEKLSCELLERVSIPCRKALVDSGLSGDKIHSVELVGSGSRIPAIMRILTSLFGREPRRTLNASECVARGCALQCAMLSPIFRVREYEVQDSFPFSVGFSTDQGNICTPTNGVIFPKGNPFPSVKLIALHRTNTFHIEAFYSNPNELPPGVKPQISKFMIGPFQAPNTEKLKVKVRVHLNLHGVLTIESASLIEDHSSDISTRGNHNHVHVSSEKVESDHHVSRDKNSFAEDTHPSTPSAGDEMRKGKVRRQEIGVSEHVYGGMSKSELSQAQNKEYQLTKQDFEMEKTKDKKNSLEAFVYETRNKLLNTYRSFSTESEREGICTNLQQTEDWLYEDGDDETEIVYTQKLDGLKKLVVPIENRFKDEEARAQATRDLLYSIVEYRIAVERSVPAADRDLVLNECNKAEQWLREKTTQQDALPKNADPVLWSTDIKAREEALNSVCKHLVPKPSQRSRSDNNMNSEQQRNR